MQKGYTCTGEDWELYLNHDTNIYCLSRGESIGLALVAESGLISLIAVAFVFVIIFRNFARHIRNTRGTPAQWHIVSQAMDVFMLNLFFSDLVQALGAVMDVRWIHSGIVQTGGFCTAQGIVQQLGESSAAMTTLVITLATFIGVWCGKLASPLLATCIVAGIWIFTITMTAAGNGLHDGTDDPYIVPTPYWCWIGEKYFGFRLAGEYIWFWITLCASILLYIPLYFWSRGNITIDDKCWWRFSFHRIHNNPHADPTGGRRQALIMISYPLVYSILVLPLSVVRWIGFLDNDPQPPALTMTVASIYGLSGAANVLLLRLTRPNSVLFGHTTYGPGAGPDDSSHFTLDIARRRESAERYRKRPGDDLGLGRLGTRTGDGGRSTGDFSNYHSERFSTDES
ncbi:hypothetical protein BD626DRAFT_423053 [Schizophyllum amplum]|uniref:Glucose receptor Git3 N-terminal domain-containing protein n=1 Tax=Schizophyllum amplum TaxID=97359 RepID=A0A550CZR3_9AGAR|nr:hypothetical protein BD626DRAFT_423053 [Auriculariopsis ampla]